MRSTYQILIGLAFVVFAATGSQASFAASSCGVENLTTLSFTRIEALLRRDVKFGHDGYIRQSISEREFRDLWQNTFPHLRKLASESGTTVVSLVEEYTTLHELIREKVYGSDNQPVELMRTVYHSFLMALARLEELPPGAKMKSRNWEDVGRVHASLSNLAVLAFRMEKGRLLAPSFDPLAQITPRQIDKIFDSLDDAGLDAAAVVAEDYRARRNSWSKLTADRDESQVVTPIAPGVEAQLEARPDFSNETNLAIVILEKVELKADFVYYATTSYGKTLQVTLSKEIVEESKGANSRAVLKLLRAVIYGHSHQSGIKTLFDIGPDIVELKAVLGAHWRIFGCLEGQSLRLKKMLNIQASRNAYSNRIPADFCAE